MEWQPIETAPKDKRFVALLYCTPTYRRYGVGWYQPMTGWQGWYHSGWKESPTHWMPLPEPPTGGE